MSVAWTWPLATRLGSRIPHDPGDPILNTWIVWWNAQAVPFTSRWWNPPFLFPMRGALALSEHLAGLGIITTPIQMAGGNAILAYNSALILSYALSGFFAFLLVRRLSGSTLAAVAGGIAYGFAPYRAGQLGHIQVLTSQWLPLALLGLHDYVETGRRRALAVFAGAWLVQSLSNGYYMLFFPVLLAGWTAWFVDWRQRPRAGAAIALAWAGASLPLVPILWKYRSVQSALGLSRSLTDMEQFSATPASLLRAAPLLAFWRSLPSRTNEDYLFPGVTLFVLIAAAVALRVWRGRLPHPASGRRAPLLFYAAAAVLMYALSFGPAHPGSGIAAALHPYSLLAVLPGYGGLRAPARFAMLGTLCLSVAGGLAFHQILRGTGRARPVVGAIVLAGLVVDGWMGPMPMIGPPGRLPAANLGSAAVLELPADDAGVNVAAMYRAMFHRRPLVNGYTGYIPPHYAILAIGLHRGDPSIPFELARGRPLVILISDRSDRGDEWKRYVEGLPGIERQGTGSGGAMYVLAAQPAARTAPQGTVLQAVVHEVRPEWIEADLGADRTVRTIAFPVRWHYNELGRRMAIEASSDGATWSTVWEDWTGGPVLAAALEAPLLVPVRLVLPDIRARYLRIHPAPPWLARELTVEEP